MKVNASIAVVIVLVTLLLFSLMCRDQFISTFESGDGIVDGRTYFCEDTGSYYRGYKGTLALYPNDTIMKSWVGTNPKITKIKSCRLYSNPQRTIIGPTVMHQLIRNPAVDVDYTCGNAPDVNSPPFSPNGIYRSVRNALGNISLRQYRNGTVRKLWNPSMTKPVRIDCSLAEFGPQIMKGRNDTAIHM